MAQTVLIKRSTTTDVPPSLANGELAYSSSSNKLFIGRPGGSTGDVDAIGGKYYTDFINNLSTVGSGNITGDVTATLSYDIVNGTISGTASIAEQTYYADATDVQFHVPTDSYKVAGDTNAIDTSITKSGTAVTLTVDHKDLLASGTADQSYGSATTIPVITVNAQGHVTSINSTSISTSSSTALSISDDNDDTSLVSLTSDTLKFAGGTYLSSDISVDGTTDIVTFSHDATTRTDTTSAETTTNGGTFDVVDSITTNNEGHVTGIDVKTVTLPNIQEVDTLDSVTTRGSTTDNDIQVNDIRVDGGNITGPATITIDPDATGVTGTVVIAGDLTVQGTTTTINSTVVEVGDNLIELNKDATGVPAINAGIAINRGDYVNVSLEWNETSDAWQVSLPNVAQDAVTVENLVTDVNFEALVTAIDGGTF
jgi:hypothetical protein